MPSSISNSDRQEKSAPTSGKEIERQFVVLELLDNEIEIVVCPADQSLPATAEALGGYEASDFLWAKAEGVSRMDAVFLTFRHRMSRFVVHLAKGEDYTVDIPKEAIVRIHNTVVAANIDLYSGIVTKNAYEGAKSITIHKESTGVYSAIVIPQCLDSHCHLVEILVNGVSYLIESVFVSN